MKKILALILAAALALSLVACGSDGTGDSNTPGGENTLPPATDKSVDNTKVIVALAHFFFSCGLGRIVSFHIGLHICRAAFVNF